MIDTLVGNVYNFGVIWTFRIHILPRIQAVFSKGSFNRLHQRQVKAFVGKVIKPVVDKYKAMDLSVAPEPIPDDSPIWVCWWQGEEQMPELCRYCIQSIRANRGKHPVILVTKDNYKEYADVPDIFLKRLKSGDMSVTHFTDTLRFCLLKQNGGIWLDSAMWLLRPLNTTGLFLYTNKNHPKSDVFISDYRWTGGAFGGSKGLSLFKFLCECYEVYWSAYSRPIDFMIMDYFICAAYDNIPPIKDLLDLFPYNNPDFYALKHQLNCTFRKTYLNYLGTRNDLLSLNRRIEGKEFDDEGQITYFGYLKKTCGRE